MYNLLIVDDEPIIVDIIYDLLSGMDGHELELFRAFSAQEAVSLLQRVQMDVIISDIRMPGMSGLELQNYVRHIWPRSKFIFLTGYNDFNYIHEAVRHDIVDYILKNEDDENIVQAVNKALDQIEKERTDNQLLEKSKRQYHLAIPKLREQYLLELLISDTPSRNVSQERFDELGIDLNADDPVYMLLGKVDQWPPAYSFSDRAQMLYAVQNIAEEWTGSFVKGITVTYDRNKLIWFIQPKQLDHGEKIELMVTAALDSIQISSLQLLSLPLSFIFNPAPSQWGDIAKSLEKLISKLYRSIGHEKKIVILEATPNQDENAGNIQLLVSANELQNWEMLLETGQKEMFNLETEPFLKVLSDPCHEESYFFFQNYYAMVSMILSYMIKRGLNKDVFFHSLIERLSRDAVDSDWPERIQSLLRLIDLLFEQQTDERIRETRAIIQRANEYVDRHLDGDLSLNAVAGYVFLSPSYFSRLYKQETGKKYSDYVLQRRLGAAKQYLKDPGMKIHEIAQKIGFESAAYFTSFFKKHMNLTPQQYRSKN